MTDTQTDATINICEKSNLRGGGCYKNQNPVDDLGGGTKIWMPFLWVGYSILTVPVGQFLHRLVIDYGRSPNNTFFATPNINWLRLLWVKIKGLDPSCETGLTRAQYELVISSDWKRKGYWGVVTGHDGKDSFKLCVTFCFCGLLVKRFSKN